ncbi:hypothetical protein Plo01_09060 [Planobispora longispora]|uniref:Uncharacterized protein n=1 Tax=Planobispora longispora TaxID=28887 RepID=A0A8J3W363_9ACTN|nr:hypothetical protein Plo01_09060 [Planobispora longispora]
MQGQDGGVPRVENHAQILRGPGAPTAADVMPRPDDAAAPRIASGVTGRAAASPGRTQNER